MKSLELLIAAGIGPPSRYKLTRFPVAVIHRNDSLLDISSETSNEPPVKIISVAGRCFLVVNDSSVPVSIGGKPAIPKTLFEIKEGSTFKIGEITAEVCSTDLPCPSGTRTGFGGLLERFEPDLAVPATPSLLFMSGENAGDFISLASVNESGGILAGRSPVCRIRSADPYVSGRHFVIRNIKGRYRLSDAGSRNGTKINGKKTGRMSNLRDGDLISAGKMLFMFLNPDTGILPDCGQPGLSIWRDRTAVFRIILPATGAGLIGFFLTLAAFLFSE